MKYMGSKNRIAKHILPIIQSARGDRTWVEPFVGGCNMIDKVGGDRIGNDINYYLIEMWKALQKGWEMPDNITEQEYQNIRQNKDEYPPELVGFVGFNTTYGGKWFGGYARGKNSKGKPRNYTDECKRNIQKQLPLLLNVEFTNMTYWKMDIPTYSLIYCDPPYQGTTNYKAKNFNHKEFWQWCRNKENDGHIVFVSEYQAPDDFECVWSKTISCQLAKKNKDRIERLFTPNNPNKIGIFIF